MSQSIFCIAFSRGTNKYIALLHPKAPINCESTLMKTSSMLTRSVWAKISCTWCTFLLANWTKICKVTTAHRCLLDLVMIGRTNVGYFPPLSVWVISLPWFFSWRVGCIPDNFQLKYCHCGHWFLLDVWWQLHMLQVTPWSSRWH